MCTRDIIDHVPCVLNNPNAFEDNAEYSFTVPVNVFGIDIVMPVENGSVDIEVFGIGDSREELSDKVKVLRVCNCT